MACSLRAVLLLLFLAAASAREIPHFDISLDEPPAERWRAVAEKFGPQVGAVARSYITKIVPKELMPLFRPIALSLDLFLKEPYHSELVGYSRYSKVPLEDLVAMQIIYDLTAFCTSIVCVDAHNTIWHARNLDYGFSPQASDALKNITVSLRVVRDKQTLINMVTFAGLLGTFTGVRPGAFTVTLNERDQGSFVSNLEEILYEILYSKRLRPASLLLRDTLENVGDYRTALNTLTKAKLIAPAYIILGGLSGDQGAIVTRFQNSVVDVYPLNVTAGRWFVLETNYDHWTPPPPSDDRRDPGMKAMKTMGKGNVTKASLFKVLRTPHVLNSGTVFTTVMSAASDFVESVIP